MSNDTSSQNYTRIIHYPYPNATDYYGTLIDKWDMAIDDTQGYYADPFMTFGDIASAQDPYTEYFTYPFVIFDGTCWDGDIQNCTSICTDPAKLFANATISEEGEPKLNASVPQNLAVCMYYPALSKLLATEGRGMDNNSWASLQEIGKQYNIVTNASADMIQTMVDIQVNCYTVYCELQSENPCVNYDTDTYDYQAITGPGVLPLFPDWSTISADDTMSINSDIGGIGVSIAYAIEFALILFIWLALRFPRFLRWLRRSRFNRNRGTQVGSDMTPAINRREKLQQAVHNHSARLQERVTELLTDFHQAQCWFFIPLNLTVLLGLGGATKVFEINSLGSLVRNMSFVQCVTQGGIVFAVATMYFLVFESHLCEEAFEERVKQEDEKTQEATMRAGEHDRHGINDPKRMLVCWVLTFVSVTLGTIAWYWSFQIRHPAKVVDAMTVSGKVPWAAYCGLVSPATYNGELWTPGNWTHKPEMKRRLPIVIFNWIIILGIFVYFFRARIARVLHKGRIFDKPMGWVSEGAVLKWFKHTVIFLLEVGVLIFLGFFMKDYVGLMRPDLPQISKDFTMGQLLATFVWAPVFVNAFYLLWDYTVSMTSALVANKHIDETEYIQMSTKTDLPPQQEPLYDPALGQWVYTTAGQSSRNEP